MEKARKRILKKRARVLFAQFREILLRDWDPLGFYVPEDEYDEYGARVLAQALRGVPPEEIAHFLLEVGIGFGLNETQDPTGRCMMVSRKLVDLVEAEAINDC